MTDGQPDAIDPRTLKKIALRHILRYFRDKKYFCGGPIPAARLYSSRSVNMVLQCDPWSFEEYCKRYIHPHLYPEVDQVQKREDYASSSVPYDVHYTLCLIKDMQRKGVPKDFQWGMMLLYFEFCKGFSIPETDD